jgi:hypothetical protein
MHDNLSREELLEFLKAKNAEISKFAPKLTFDQRCEILALRHAGVRREVLANMYGVDRRTITHIYNPFSPHYKNVRELEIGMGKEQFRDKFADTELLNKALANSVVEGGNNRYANKRAGVNIMRGPMCNYDHRVIIEWRTPENTRGITEEGWCYRDMDSDSPDDWFVAAGSDSMKNSQACYAAALGELMDKL